MFERRPELKYSFKLRLAISSSLLILSQNSFAQIKLCELALKKAAQKLEELKSEQAREALADQLQNKLDAAKNSIASQAATIAEKASEVKSEFGDKIQAKVEAAKPIISSAIEQGKEVVSAAKETINQKLDETLEAQTKEVQSSTSDVKVDPSIESIKIELKEQARKKLERRIAKEAKKVRSHFAKSKMTDTLDQQFRDRIQGEYLKSVLTEYEGYVLLLGNSESAVDPKVQEQIEILLSKLVRNRQPFLYDADSAWAPLIQQKASKLGMGVTGNPKKEDDSTYLIQNPFIRTMVFLAGSKIIHTPDSITGTGSFIMGSDFTKPGRSNFYVLDVNNEWNEGLAQFGVGLQPDKKERKKLGEKNKGKVFPPADLTLLALPDLRPVNAGVKYDKTTQSTKFTDSSKLVTPYNINLFDNWVPFETQMQVTADTKLLTLYRSVLQHHGLINQLTHLTESAHLDQQKPKSAVFGSAGETPYDQLSYKIIEALGSQSQYVIHGGSGGIMYQTGRIMKQIGTFTVGVPIVGKESLKTEDTVPREVHDLTLEADGYESRIDALLYDIDQIGFAPGGKGTMRELAATLIREASTPASTNKLIFFPQEYYQGLYNYLQSLPLPTHLKSRILLVNSPEEAAAVK